MLHTPVSMERVGVYGIGRFGSFWAQMLSRRCEVLAAGRTQRPLPSPIQFVRVEELAQVDSIFLCVSISSIPEVVDSLATVLRPGQLVLDTCSVKSFPVREMVNRLPQNVQIVATHPMFGPDSAAERTDPLPIITWPVRVDDDRYSRWQTLFQQLGMRVIQMSPEEHDREAAFTQGITHYIGRVLARMELKPSEISTLGYRRLLQVMEQTCNDPIQLFRDLQRYNPYTRTMREQLRRAEEEIELMLNSGQHMS